MGCGGGVGGGGGGVGVVQAGGVVASAREDILCFLADGLSTPDSSASARARLYAEDYYNDSGQSDYN